MKFNPEYFYFTPSTSKSHISEMFLNVDHAKHLLKCCVCFPMYYRTEDADILFQEAAVKNLTGVGYAWIVTEQALEAPNVPLGLYTNSSLCYFNTLI